MVLSFGNIGLCTLKSYFVSLSLSSSIYMNAIQNKWRMICLRHFWHDFKYKFTHYTDWSGEVQGLNPGGHHVIEVHLKLPMFSQEPLSSIHDLSQVSTSQTQFSSLSRTVLWQSALQMYILYTVSVLILWWGTRLDFLLSDVTLPLKVAWKAGRYKTSVNLWINLTFLMD